MASTPKPVRRVIKRLAASNRKQISKGLKSGQLKKTDVPSKKNLHKSRKEIVKRENKTHGWVR